MAVISCLHDESETAILSASVNTIPTFCLVIRLCKLLRRTEKCTFIWRKRRLFAEVSVSFTRNFTYVRSHSMFCEAPCTFVFAIGDRQCIMSLLWCRSNSHRTESVLRTDRKRTSRLDGDTENWTACAVRWRRLQPLVHNVSCYTRRHYPPPHVILLEAVPPIIRQL